MVAGSNPVTPTGKNEGVKFLLSSFFISLGQRNNLRDFMGQRNNLRDFIFKHII